MEGKGNLAHEDAYEHLPFKKEDELAAAVTLKNPTFHGAGGPRRGFIHGTQLFGSAAAVLHYTCFSRALASLARRISKIPCIEYYGDFSIAAPSCLVDQPLGAVAELNGAFPVARKNHKSEADYFSESRETTGAFERTGETR